MDTTPLPTITTILPTYRRPEFLKRAIRSVLDQTYPHFKLCIYDNASGDETASVVKSLMAEDSRIEYHCHQKNIGALRNFIYGIERVKTHFFNILCDDDIVLPHFYDIAILEMKKEAKAGFFFGSTIRVDSENNFLEVPVSKWKNGIYFPHGGFLKLLKEGYQPEWPATLFRTEVLSNCKLDPEIPTWLDLEFQLQIAAQRPFIVNTIPCAIFAMYPIVTPVRFKIDYMLPGLFRMQNKISSMYSLPAEVKKKAETLVIRRSKNIVFRFGLRGALTGYPEEALSAHKYLSANSNNILHIKLLASFLQHIVRSHYTISVLKVAWFIRQKLKIIFSKRWEIKYKFYKIYLNEISKNSKHCLKHYGDE